MNDARGVLKNVVSINDPIMQAIKDVFDRRERIKEKCSCIKMMIAKVDLKRCYL